MQLTEAMDVENNDNMESKDMKKGKRKRITFSENIQTMDESKSARTISYEEVLN